MITAQQDTEITLGTGRMLGIFFGLVLVCAFCFAIGFSLGRKTAMAGGGGGFAPTAAPSTVVRPSASKNDTRTATQSGDFSFYKSVGEKKADGALTPPESKAATAATSAPAADASKGAADVATPPPTTAGGGYFVQVAAVTRKEDAESLVEALKKKQYPAFSTNLAAGDKFYRVQIGPYADTKEAEAMRARLIGDGYNPIVKK